MIEGREPTEIEKPEFHQGELEEIPWSEMTGEQRQARRDWLIRIQAQHYGYDFTPKQMKDFHGMNTKIIPEETARLAELRKAQHAGELDEDPIRRQELVDLQEKESEKN